jgi:uncharacterized protein (TIGR01777 family)
MRILLTGGTGFIGSALVVALQARGDELIILSRQARGSLPGCRFVRSLDEIAAGEEINAIINLAGASLAARRWSAAYKREIVASRLDTTGNLLDLVRRLSRPPQSLLSASAIGYYGLHGDEYLTESSAVTPGFAQTLCADWESLALQAQQHGVRVCLLRLGVVLDRTGADGPIVSLWCRQLARQRAAVAELGTPAGCHPRNTVPAGTGRPAGALQHHQSRACNRVRLRHGPGRASPYVHSSGRAGPGHARPGG